MTRLDDAPGLVRVYNALPEPLAAVTSALHYALLSRHPIVAHAVDGRQRLARGTVLFSVDFEMAWAWRYAAFRSGNAVERGLREREQVPHILAAFSRYNVPATWATVGHLFLSSCYRDPGGLPHAACRRPRYFESRYIKFKSGDWFQHDPCTDVYRDPAWYAPDLIESIMRSPAGHEIACHSFSHVGFGESYCGPEVAASELDACIEAMRPFGLRPVSLVFPTNDKGNFPVLAEKGIRIVRAFPEPNIDLALPLRGSDGVWEVHASLHVESRPGRMNRAVHLMRLRSYLARAIREKLAVHFWFHPSFDRKDLDEILTPFLRHCAELRDKGRLDIMTMREVVKSIDPDDASLNDRITQC